MYFKKMFEPIKIGTMELKNRIVMPAMGTSFADESGYITDRMVAYYVARAKGGASLIIVGNALVDRYHRHRPKGLSIHDDTYIIGFQKLAAALKENGAKCAVQLMHHGRDALEQQGSGLQPVAPSSIARYGREVPKELTVQEIAELIEEFANAAKRVKQAGFDAVELHAGHGHLVAQFLSPLVNKRTDNYGGSLENRARFAIEILKHMRVSVGQDFPLFVRFSADSYMKGGVTLNDGKRLARMFEQAGVDAISVSGGDRASSEEGYISQLVHQSSLPMAFPRGFFLPLAEAIKKVASVPVLVEGRIGMELGEQILMEGKADLIVMGRALLADPELPVKTYEGRYDDIRHCLACNTCILQLFRVDSLECAINAELGHEEEYRLKPAGRLKKVLVVGGGPSGMEAARVAALRGHEVTLCEKNGWLGGNLVPASTLAFKEDLRLLLKHLSTQISKSKVKVRLRVEVDEDIVEQLRPDAVIVATGAKPITPQAVDADRLSAGGIIVTYGVDVLSGNVTVGQKAIIIGSGMTGCETATFLAERGKEVTMVEERGLEFSLTGGLASDMEPALRAWFLFELWPKFDVQLIPYSTFVSVTDGGAIVSDRNGDQRTIKGDTIIFCVGLSSDKRVAQTLKKKVPELYEIGDCVEPRKIIDAVHEGAHVGRMI
ncbi:FAD-dependent oxidoreductase [Chloroflexota bacterium]